ncbi:hypothetical protein GCM10011583_11760 [Streptomyces camponoticapitis]|uniref:Secreted protein n=1 Tax=Streptomyces camponoticapitis TaxID=1616125 RepID=A0ABQ2E269_9ACTN|nr:hypothetical protein [Streptomyces camponoticapitis]GGJ81929.1 hypothetical protein GCM10011583_11760 [Streptomyces camponoticapitis]
MRTAAIRALAYVALLVIVGMGSAATFAYVLLDDSSWTDRPAEAATPRPAPKPSQTARPAPDAVTASDCYTPDLAPVGCTRDGALAVVGVIDQPTKCPCSRFPETVLVWHTGTKALCLASPR